MQDFIGCERCSWNKTEIFKNQQCAGLFYLVFELFDSNLDIGGYVLCIV